MRRQNGKMPVALVSANTLAEATCKAWRTCARYGTRVANVKQRPDEPLARDISLLVSVRDPLREPMLFKPGMPGDQVAFEKYRLEVVFGIYNHRIGHGWDYTYHGRLEPQVPLLLDKIETTWLEKGRITSRDFQLTTWQWTNDLKIDDPPCLQIVHLRFLPTLQPGQHRLNLTVVFRSRDLGNAFLMNAYAFIHLQRHLARIVQERLEKYELTVGMGSYADFSISNHLYGGDEDRRHLVRTLERLENEPWTKFALRSDVFLPPERLVEIRHMAAAQLAWEVASRGTDNPVCEPSPQMMDEAGIDWHNWPYPQEWDL